MTPSLRWMLPGLLGILACGGRRESADRDSVLAVSDAPRPADSLLLTTPAGIQVWFAAARMAQDSGGTRCIERVMEIRSEGRVTPIPLLYTGTPPRLVNDSTIEATIWLNCRPGNVYRVDLRTGQPVRVK
jgi:hypothetical protein